ncbi:hypothetical protein BRPE64_ACDS09900 [Caballeronia insecticola]|uniref:Uncharacterized protein n=1 Tax=Caballeronia insecticola TaxID=758793 RepID=R4WGA6_9BURK|nr:hypothetical protein BRPE64_ACDS09900 [Caballeronia insecticola]
MNSYSSDGLNRPFSKASPTLRQQKTGRMGRFLQDVFATRQAQV